MIKIIRVTVVLISISLISCSSTMKNVTLKRAAFDLDCPVDKLQIHELTTRTWGVRGCGKKATYITQGECSIESTCLPMMNNGNEASEK